MDVIASTPPPYYAVTFTSVRTAEAVGCAELAQHMLKLARLQPGFLGYESARQGRGARISVSNWETPEAILAWRRHAEQRIAQPDSDRWYLQSRIRLCRVQRSD